MFSRPKVGFTLIELLIVVAIIGILAAIAIPNFLEAQVRAKVAAVYSDFHNTRLAMESYYIDNDDYPLDWWWPPHDVTSWILMTTPIAYMSSVPRSPFIEEQSFIADDFYLYEYWRGAGPSYDDGARYNVHWRFTSFGPDGRADYAYSYASNFPEYIATNDIRYQVGLYDPTNWSLSAGDLLVSNLGIHPLDK